LVGGWRVAVVELLGFGREDPRGERAVQSRPAMLWWGWIALRVGRCVERVGG